MSCLGSDLSARLSAARETEAGIAGSGWYTKLDTALAEKLRLRAAKNAVLHAKKDSMLLVDAASDATLRIIEDLFPTYNRVSHVLYSTIGSDVEALRSAIYTVMFAEIVADGAIIHVGGFQDTHVVHGRHVHCEQVLAGPMEYSRAIRRYCVREQLYRNATSVKMSLGKDKLPWAMLKLADDGSHNCVNPKTCTVEAGYMVFDINVIPLSQQQVCASMMQHKCDLAQALILVEDNSTMGSAGYVSGTTVRAEYNAATGMIEYSADQGGSPEFPSIRKSVLIEWMTVSARHAYGSTFFFEIVQHYGPFSKIQITRVPGVLSVKITHRTWNINAARESGPMRVVSVPRLKDLSLSSDLLSNYESMAAVIPEKTYRAAHAYALTLAANDFRKGNIRRKLNELTNRVIVKGTSVEIVEPLHPDVVDIVALELFVKCYVERFDGSQTFKHVTAEIASTRRLAHDSRVNLITKALGAGMRAAQDWWADTVTDYVRTVLDAIIRERVNMPVVRSELSVLFAEHTTELKGKASDYGVKAAVDGMGGYFQMIMSKWSEKPPSDDGDDDEGDDDGPGGPADFPPPDDSGDSDDRDGGDANSSTGNDADGEAKSAADKIVSCARPKSVDELSASESVRGRPIRLENSSEVVPYPDIVRDYRQATLVGCDPFEDLDTTKMLALDPTLAGVVAEVSVRADMGPDGQLATWSGHKVELVMDLDDHEQRDRATVDVGDFVTILCEQYSNCFSAVAAADMSADYDLIAHGDMSFTVNVPYMRMPQDNIVGSERFVYKSKLNGPDRPNAPSETRNLLMGVIKRNADPFVLKLPCDANISWQMWENFLNKRCHANARELLAAYQSSPIDVAMPNLMAWAQRVGADKVDKVCKLLEQDGAFMMEKDLSEFKLQFKGKVKPTLSANAAQACPKFQTIMHYDTDVNMYWSAMFSDLTMRYNSLLLPNIHVGVRGNDADKLDHIRTHHPWGDENLVYVQLDMSEYDKSQESRARDFYDIMHKSLGLSEEYANEWSRGQTTNVARSMALGIKLIVPLQMKSGIATTLWGNSAYSQAIAAWLMPDVLYELGQGDDLYDVLDESKFNASGMAEKAAAVFNMPLKLIQQRVMPMRTGYFCGKFVVYDNDKKEAFLVPDPIKAVEGLSRPITEDAAKFLEMFQSYQDRMKAWRSDFPTQTFDHMVSRWYEAPNLRATYVIDALLAAGKSIETFRTMWEDELSKVK